MRLKDLISLLEKCLHLGVVDVGDHRFANKRIYFLVIGQLVLVIGADEGLMLDPHGFVNTTNACNCFIVRKGAVWTSTGDYRMNGVTRQKVIDICRNNDIPIFECNYSLFETYSTDEAFMTGTFEAKTPVSEIDCKRIGTGEHPVMDRICLLYKELITAETGATFWGRSINTTTL